MPVPYAASRQDVKINLGYIASRSVSYLKRAMFHISPILLATYTQPEPTVFDAVMRTYLACWQGNFGLKPEREHAIQRRLTDRASEWRKIAVEFRQLCLISDVDRHFCSA